MNNPNPIRVLVVDDSRFIREAIVEMLSGDPGIEVVGEAENGVAGVRLAKERQPDIITMDIDMPEMNGIEAIECIMSERAVPILVLTSRDESEIAFKAISKGALEVMGKPEMDVVSVEAFVKKVKLLSKIQVISHIRTHTYRPDPAIQPTLAAGTCTRIVAVASSTGGPKALATILSHLPQVFSMPIVVAQHINGDFLAGMIKWLNNITALRVKTGEAGETIEPGVVYVSRPEQNMVVDAANKIGYREKAAGELYSPSCDVLFSSVARHYGERAIGLILTGMGSDGTEGLVRLKQAGGATLAQDEETCAVWGMPKAATEAGCVDKELPLQDIGPYLLKLAKP